MITDYKTVNTVDLLVQFTGSLEVFRLFQQTNNLANLMNLYKEQKNKTYI